MIKILTSLIFLLSYILKEKNPPVHKHGKTSLNIWTYELGTKCMTTVPASHNHYD